MHLLYPARPLTFVEAEFNEKKVKRSKTKTKGVKQREFKNKGLLPVKNITCPWQKDLG